MKRKLLWFSFFVLTLLILANTGKNSSANEEKNKLDNVSVFDNTSSSNEFKLAFNYPKGWYVHEMVGSKLTPYAVLITDKKLEEIGHGPGNNSPDKYVNIVFHKTNESAGDYVSKDFTLREVKNATNEIIKGKAEETKKYKGDHHEGKYISSYKRSGEYLVIVESTIKNSEDVEFVEELFSSIFKTLEVKK